MLTRIAKRLTLISRSLSEVDRAKIARPPAENEDTLFGKIARKEIPANIVYEDDKVLAFRDISPAAPTHILLIPKVRDSLTRLNQIQEKHKDILGHMMWAAAEIARNEKLEEGWRLVINDGPLACQSIYHLHFHIIGGRQLGWPPG
ncbi:unnamed protein product [Blepharisma stoltei]|uniref:HIT domain-containing protein n=1 Tax=Blepharisma stoltei TaxID=1481888 RepID=A0AAU9J3L0_9CILI|nr:unnamed protein product [Blepharisma stoltei]